MTAPVNHQQRMATAIILVIVAVVALPQLLELLLGRQWRRGGRNVVTAEIKSIEASLVTFKAIYGSFPPSGLVLYGSRAEWESDPQSMSKVKRIWPQFDFDRCVGLERLPAGGTALNGAEALVFFLGGIRDPETGQLTGFSKNQAAPFALSKPREYSLFEFVLNRLVDIDSDGFPEYCDYYGPDLSPILYACEWEGQYWPQDYNQFIGDIYRRGRESDSKTWCRDFQLISPGRDRKYGIGGYFSPDDPGWASFPKSRADEFDNRLNFGMDELGKYR